MEPWQERVLAEKTELSERVGKLREFLDTPQFFNLTSEVRSLMRRQYAAMLEYEAVLAARIRLFSGVTK